LNYTRGVLNSTAMNPVIANERSKLLLLQRLDFIEQPVHARRQRTIGPRRHHIDSGLLV